MARLGHKNTPTLRQDGYAKIQILHQTITPPTKNKARMGLEMQKIGLKHDINDDFAHPKLAKSHHLSKHILYRLSANDDFK